MIWIPHFNSEMPNVVPIRVLVSMALVGWCSWCGYWSKRYSPCSAGVEWAALGWLQQQRAASSNRNGSSSEEATSRTRWLSLKRQDLVELEVISPIEALGFLYCVVKPEDPLIFQSPQGWMLTRLRWLLLLFTNLWEYGYSVQKRDHSFKTESGHFNCSGQKCKFL